MKKFKIVVVDARLRGQVLDLLRGAQMAMETCTAGDYQLNNIDYIATADHDVIRFKCVGEKFISRLNTELTNYSLHVQEDSDEMPVLRGGNLTG